MRAREVLRLLAVLGYEEVRREGLHRRLTCPNRPPITFSYHDRATVGPQVVRSILVQQVGLTREEALEVIGRG